MVYVIAEIGINHNGDIDLAERMIHAAKECGAEAVKFQKRTVDIVYTPDELAAPRNTPFGKTNGDLKRGLEFGVKEYDRIAAVARDVGIDWFGSPWDIGSLEFLLKYNPKYIKIASPCNKDAELLRACARTGIPLLVSTGMTKMPDIFKIVRFIEDNGGKIGCLFHCTSTYPAEHKELNLLGIQELHKAFPYIPTGYSGHEKTVPPTIMAISLGADFIERHFTLDRTMFGSDQAASLEPNGLRLVCSAARAWEEAKGTGMISMYPSEEPIEKKLRRVNTL